MGVAVYFLGLLVVPTLGPVQGLIQATPWLSRGDVSQITYLVLSLGLIAVLSGGSFRGYGFAGARLWQVLKPVPISVGVSLLVIVLSMILIAVTGPPKSGEHPAMSGGMLKAIISVWVVASVCEEVFNRGLVLGFLAPLKHYGFRLLRSRISLPVTVSAVGFGLGHLCLLGAMDPRLVGGAVVSATLLGFIAGYHREKTGSLLPAIVAHMTFNIVGGTISFILSVLIFEFRTPGSSSRIGGTNQNSKIKT
jgi:membrane protease YdiL (CAAX protease family)